MPWDLHGYYSNKNEGLISKLKLSEDQKESLKVLRKTVRNRTTEVFKEFQSIAKKSRDKNGDLSLSILNESISGSTLRYLIKAEQVTIKELVCQMDSRANDELLKLKPRFWTQGSFQYDTLNLPYVSPPQEMDIDDGVYLPTPLFEGEPVIAHELLILLVDTSLKSLVAENNGWEFEAKRTCARIKIPEASTHIDVPMYAIPEEQFLEKEEAVLKALAHNRQAQDSFDLESMSESKEDYAIDPECVNLALRSDTEKWTNSDPKIVEDWFIESCSRIGSHLKKLCRFLKSWRDAQWPSGGGPSSISLMAATVSILDKTPYDENNFGDTMGLIANKLSEVFNAGVDSPDHTDEKPLFPSYPEQDEEQKLIVKKVEALAQILTESENATTKHASLLKVNEAFGNRVTNHELIVSKPAAPAFKDEPNGSAKPKTISTTFTSG